MSDAGAYSGSFTLAGDPPPVINVVRASIGGTLIQDADVAATSKIFSWDAATQRVKVLTGKKNPGVYTVTLMDTVSNASCDWQVTIVLFDVPITANKPAVAANRYIINPGETITFTADTRNVLQGGYVMWDVYDLNNQLLERGTGNSLTYTPAQGIRCAPLVLLSWPLNNFALPQIEVYLRVTITQGANSRWLRGSSAGLRFVTTGNESDFDGIFCDDIANMIPLTVSAGKYNVSRDPITGGTVLTLLPAFLSSLPDGPHTLTFVYNSRRNTASTVFNIDGAGPNAPKTGDSTPLAPLCGLTLLSGAGLMASAALRRRKRRCMQR